MKPRIRRDPVLGHEDRNDPSGRETEPASTKPGIGSFAQGSWRKLSD
jgi:hypothetical protein